MNKNIESLLAEVKTPPKTHSYYSDAEVASLEGKIPEDLVAFMKAYGRCTMRDGLVHCCHPDDLKSLLALVFKADADFNHRDFVAYSYTAFGEVSFRHSVLGSGKINLLSGNVICRGLTKELPNFPEKGVFLPFRNENELYDPSAKPMFKRALKKLGELEWGQCYGFVPALAMGGERAVGSLKLQENAFAHFAFLAQLQPFYLQDIQGITPEQQPRIREIG